VFWPRGMQAVRQIRRQVGLRGFKLNPMLLTYVLDGPRARVRRRTGHRRERRVRKRLQAETIDRLVDEYVAGATAAELGQRYELAKSSVLHLVRQAGEGVRHPRLSATETAQLVALYEQGLSQKDIADRLGRSPSAIWHCLRRLGSLENRHA
jgi:DNA-binding NarL/FixJ family response regulator